MSLVCPNLTSLDCGHCVLGDSLCQLITDHKLQNLRFTHCTFAVKEAPIANIQCATMESLIVVAQYNNDKEAELLDQDLIRMFPNLKTLKGYFSRYKNNCQQIIQAAFTQWSNLTWLTLHVIADADLLLVVQGCPLVTCLDVSGPGVTDTSVIFACQTLTHLHSLAVNRTGITDETLLAVGVCCKSLRRLYLMRCGVSFEEVCSVLLVCPLITMLGISYEIRDPVDFVILPRVTSLAIDFEDDAVNEHTLLENLPVDVTRLERLELCPFQTAECISKVIAGCPQLRMLRLFYGGGLDEELQKPIRKWEAERPGLRVYEAWYIDFASCSMYFENEDDEFFMNILTYNSLVSVEV